MSSGSSAPTKVVGVIPARLASTRFHAKPLAKILGREMILWVLEGARKSQRLDEVIVATDDMTIQSLVEKNGGRVVMTDSHLPTGTDRIWSAIQGIDADVIINIQGDEPLINEKLIDPLVQAFEDHPQISMATLGHEISWEELQSLDAVKVVCDRQGQALYFSRFPIPYSRQSVTASDKIVGCLKHIGMYGYRREFLKNFCQQAPTLLEQAESLEQLRALEMGARIQVMKVDQKSWGVDRPEDILKIEEKLRSQI